MTRRRDTQRSKVYESERAIQWKQKGFHFAAQQDNYETLDDCHRFLMSVVRRKRVQERYPRAAQFTTMHLKDGRGTRSASFRGNIHDFGDYGPILNLPLWSRNELTLLHELAHSLVPSGVTHHWEFTECLLWLVRQAMGIEWHDLLLAQYKSRRVKYRAPRTRTLTPEQKAAAAERLVHARAVRAAKSLENA